MKQVPRPGSLATSIVPPMASTRECEMLSPRPVPPYRRRVDAGPWREGPAFNLIAANARFHGAGVEIAPDARIDDGLLDFVLMGDLSKREIARTYAGVFAGKGARGPKVETARGRRLEVEGDEPMLLDVDGEQIGRTPAVFEVVPGALLVRGWI